MQQPEEGLVMAEGKNSVVDVADTSPRQKSGRGKRIKAMPFSQATTVVVRGKDFQTAGNINHPDVTWDFRLNDFTVTVGEDISAEAAEFLVKNYSDSFQYVGE